MRKTTNVGEQLATALVWAVAGLVFAALIAVVGHILWHGLSGVNWSFLTEEPLRGGKRGGIAPILVSTLWILAVCMVTSVPLALATAVYLSESQSAHRGVGRVIRRSLDVLAAVPSIVFGLFGNAFFCITLGMGYSIAAGGLTLACMVLPLLIRTTEVGLRMVPNEQRMAAAALTLSPSRTLFNVLLPAAAPALIVGLVLSIGRALAETAALIFTSGYVDRMPSALSDSGRALSIHIYDLTMNISGGEKNAYASAIVLISLLFIINVIATAITRIFLKPVSPCT